jgi:hypothetical protein
MEQYFTNALFSFKPTFKNAKETYRVFLYINGSGEYRVNTNVSTRNPSGGNPSYIFYNNDGTNYTSSIYKEEYYFAGSKVGIIESKAVVSNQLTCDNINRTILGYFNYNVNGGSLYKYTFPINGLYLVTCGDNYNDTNLIDVFYFYAGASNYGTLQNKAIFHTSLSTITQIDNSSFSISVNAPSNYNFFKISYQKIN